MTARLLVVDDHTLVRQGIVKLLSGQSEVEVVGEAANGFEAITKAQELDVDVVLMDLYMPGLDGVATTRLIRRESPNVAVIVLTASDDEDDLFEALQAGARGYILKSADNVAFLYQLNQVISGGVGMDEEVKIKLVTGLARRGSERLSPDYSDHEVLSEREKEVLTHIATGATNKEMANTLFISENTIRAHVRTLMQKLHLDNRTKLAVYGVHEGYTVGSRGSAAVRQGRFDGN